ncbi:MAG: RAD55 family ATPase [Nanobdellota archaeon]
MSEKKNSKKDSSKEVHLGSQQTKKKAKQETRKETRKETKEEHKKGTQKTAAKPVTAAKDSKKKKPSPFAGLKDQIMQEMNSGGKSNSSSSKDSSSQGKSGSSKKIDMAFLKSTVEESLKSPKKESDYETKRCPTGIPGFDGTIEGGFVKDSVNLICGGPGSGKSIFAMQSLVNGIDKYGENAVYITFEEEVDTLLADMKRFGWGLEEKIKNKQLAVVYYSPEQIDRVLYVGGGPIREIIDETNAQRIVIDSISAFSRLYKTENQIRRALMSLFKILKKWGCTSLLIEEETIKPDEHQATVEEFQAEGIVFLYHAKKGEVRERSIEVFKMRGTDHSTKINPLKISDAGITVYPEENVY